MMLVLPMYRNYFDMILDGVKKEEYRVPKPYWIKRFEKAWEGMDKKTEQKVFFRNGYTNKSPYFVAICSWEGIRKGNPSWGAEEDKEYLVLKVHRVVETGNLEK